MELAGLCRLKVKLSVSFLKDTESFKSMIACQVNLSASVIAHYKSKFMKTSSALRKERKKKTGSSLTILIRL